MYIAIQEIGGYKIGEEVPTEKAETWLKAYAVPHVKKVDHKGKKPSTEEVDTSRAESSTDVMLEDYLGRNTNVVIKNVQEDNLSKEQLKNLLELEESNKKRRAIIKAIKKRLIKLGN